MNCPDCGNDSLNVVYGFLSCWVECFHPDCYWQSGIKDKPIIEAAMIEAACKIYQVVIQKEKSHDQR